MRAASLAARQAAERFAHEIVEAERTLGRDRVSGNGTTPASRAEATAGAAATAVAAAMDAGIPVPCDGTPGPPPGRHREDDRPLTDGSAAFRWRCLPEGSCAPGGAIGATPPPLASMASPPAAEAATLRRDEPTGATQGSKVTSDDCRVELQVLTTDRGPGGSGEGLEAAIGESLLPQE